MHKAIIAQYAPVIKLWGKSEMTRNDSMTYFPQSSNLACSISLATWRRRCNGPSCAQDGSTPWAAKVQPARNRFCPQSLEHVALPDSICTIVFVCIYVSMYLCIYVCTYKCLFVCLFACLFVCLFDFVGMSCMSVRPSVRTLARTEGGRQGGTYIAMFVNTYRIQMHAISQSVRRKRQKTFFPTWKHRRFLTCLIETGCLGVWMWRPSARFEDHS